MLCEIFTVIYIVLDSTALQVWHFALLPAFNIHCSELTTHLARYVFISSDLNVMLSALIAEKWVFESAKEQLLKSLEKVVGTFFYAIMKGKQECNHASKHQMNSTQQWMQSFFLSADMDCQCVKDQQRSFPCMATEGHQNLLQHSCKKVKSSALLWIYKVKGLFQSKNLNCPSITCESMQRLDLWSLPRAYFGRIKNSTAPCSLTESKLPSSNT